MILFYFLILIKKQNKKEFKAKIKEIKKYNTFSSMIKTEGIDKILPDSKIHTIDDGVAVYRQWYAPDVENKYGVIAIRVELIP